MFAPFYVKNWSNFFVSFLFLKISFSLQKEEYLFNKKTNDLNVVLKIGPILLRNMLGPVFILTQPWGPVFNTLFLVFFFLGGGGLKPPILQCFQQSMQILKKDKNKRKTICEHTCANRSCQNFLFCFLHFSFCFFLQYPHF